MGKTRKRVSEKRVRSRVRSQKGGKCCLYEGKPSSLTGYTTPEQEDKNECWRHIETLSGDPGLVGAQSHRKGDVGCVFLTKNKKQCVAWRPALLNADPIGVWYSNHFWKHFDAVAGMQCYNPGHLQTFVDGFLPNMYIGHEEWTGAGFSLKLLDLQETKRSLAEAPPTYEYLEASAETHKAKPTHSLDNWAAFTAILGSADRDSKLSAVGEDTNTPGVGGYRLVFNPGNLGDPKKINGKPVYGMLLFTLIPLKAPFGIVAGRDIGGETAYPVPPNPTAFNDMKFNQLPKYHYNNIQANSKIISIASVAASPQLASGSGVAGGAGGGGGGSGNGEEELKKLQATTEMMDQYMGPRIRELVKGGILTRPDETRHAYKTRHKKHSTDKNTAGMGLQYLDHWRNIEEAKKVLKEAEEVHRDAEATKEMIKWMNAGAPLKVELAAAIASGNKVAEELKDACDAAAAAAGSPTDAAAADATAADATAAAAKGETTTELDSVILKAKNWEADVHSRYIPAEKKAGAAQVLEAVQELLEKADKVRKCIQIDRGSCLESAECLTEAAQATKVADFKAEIRREREAAESRRSADVLATGSQAMAAALMADVPPGPTGAAAEPPLPPPASADGTKRPGTKAMGGVVASRTMGAVKKVKKTKTKAGEFNLADSGDDLRTVAQRKAADKKTAEALKAAGIAKAQRGTKKGRKGGAGGGRARTRKRRRTRRKMNKYTRRPRHNRGRRTRRR